MKVSVGLGWLFSPLRYRRARRIAAVGAFAMGVFSFITFDLAPRDGHLTVSFLENITAGIAYLDFTNQTEHPVTGLDAEFAFYDYQGALLEADTFVPRGMTVEANKGKEASFGAERFDPTNTAFIFLCGTFDGSYLTDQIREVWLLTRKTVTGDQSFAQGYYLRERYLISTPDCTRPENLQDFAAETGFELEKTLQKFQDAGMVPSPQG